VNSLLSHTQEKLLMNTFIATVFLQKKTMYI